MGGGGVGRGLTEEQLKGAAAKKGRKRRAEFGRDSATDGQLKEKTRRSDLNGAIGRGRGRNRALKKMGSG